MKAGLAVTDVVRTSNTVVTVTLPAFASYDITAAETITATVPASAVTSASTIIATPTFIILTVIPSGQQEFVDDGVFTVPGGVNQFTIKGWGGGGGAGSKDTGAGGDGGAVAMSRTSSPALREATRSALPSVAAGRAVTGVDT